MSSSAIDNFERKRAEISSYLAFAQLLEGSTIVSGDGAQHPVELDTKTILKANFFVMYYNLVESAVREILIEIYDEALNHVSSFNELARCWRRTVVKSMAHEREAHKVSPSRYYDLTLDVAEFITQGVAMPLKRIALSGNVDQNLIQKLAQAHEIAFEIPRECRAGTDLKTIKDNRNKLAHGNVTFTELGRDYVTSELGEMASRANLYMKAFLDGAISYRDAKQFLKRAV